MLVSILFTLVPAAFAQSSSSAVPSVCNTSPYDTEAACICAMDSHYSPSWWGGTDHTNCPYTGYADITTHNTCFDLMAHMSGFTAPSADAEAVESWSLRKGHYIAAMAIPVHEWDPMDPTLVVSQSAPDMLGTWGNEKAFQGGLWHVWDGGFYIKIDTHGRPLLDAFLYDTNGDGIRDTVGVQVDAPLEIWTWPVIVPGATYHVP